MGFFNRRNQAADANTANAVGREKHGRNTVMNSRERRNRGKERVNYSDGTLNNRPRIGQWIKMTWPDILTMLVMGVIGLGVSMAYLRA